MGIVASLAASPVANAIAEDEARRELERLRLEEERLKRQREAEMYRLGDADLELIKRLSKEIHVTEQHSPDRAKFREGHTKVQDVEKVYLTGTYKVKYKMLSENLAANSNYKLFPPPPLTEPDGSVRKTRSAYPTVRIRPVKTSHRIYSQHTSHMGTPKMSVSHVYLNGTPRHFSVPLFHNFNGVKHNGNAAASTPKHSSVIHCNGNTKSSVSATPKHNPETLIHWNGTGGKHNNNNVHHNATPKHHPETLIHWNGTGKHNNIHQNATPKSIKQH